MKKAILFLALFCLTILLGQTAADDNQIKSGCTGRVIDALLKGPIGFAQFEIKTENSDRILAEGISDENGTICIPRLPRATYTLVVRRVGYTTYIKKIDLSEDGIVLGDIGMKRAQDTVFTEHYKVFLDSIESSALKQKRYVQVFMPRGYDPTANKTYDVLYVLDGGNWNTGLVNQIQRFVQNEGNMPPTLIVSVMGIDRNVELTPSPLPNWKGSGGAKDFLTYITTELIPLIDDKYPTNGTNTLWGHSLSGMFAIYAMLNTNAFTSFMAMDPALWWDNDLVLNMAKKTLPNFTKERRTLFMCGQSGRTLEHMRVNVMDSLLQKLAPENLIFKTVSYPDESHSSLRLKGTYDGFMFTYSGMTNNLVFHPMAGEVIDGEPYSVWVFNEGKNSRYTLDGSVPTLTAEMTIPEIKLDKPTDLRIKSFSNRGTYDKVYQGAFKASESWQAKSNPKALVSGALSYKIYDVEWDHWPKQNKMEATQSGTVDGDFSFNDLPKDKPYALEIEGYIEVQEPGYHIFVIQTTPGSSLFFNQKKIIKWEKEHKSMSYILPLEKGRYPIRITHINRRKNDPLGLYYITPSILPSKQPIKLPKEILYHEPLPLK
ncbi:alpha/beta hydrolase-fold protein [Sediminicola luteus]|uniref:PA14 domain-containing protein n=1 Tax=Sediminicola luteus TaxID=319238 RepID=A0A2A4G0A4_9FLAO|nr:alpha/beta hydrolase-fold protein [Sediminicola luteus]PCE62429.1 hypothetical protein B7P33_18930 [Sediminicola luteus]